MTGFSIYTRTRKNGKAVFYARFKKPDGSYTTAVSTGCTTKRDAETWRIKYLQKNTIYFHDNVILKDFAKDFFNYDGTWARSKRITGKRLSEKWCMQRQRLTDKYIVPSLGKYKLSAIKKPVIDDFRNGLFYDQKLAGQTVNHILISLRLMLLFAEERGLLPAVPTIETVKGDAAKPKQEKGILTIEEAQQLFFSVSWSNYTAYVFALTAALTGIRRGELLAVQLKNVKNGYLEIQKTWDTELLRLTTTTKNGKHRNVVLTEKLYTAIMRLAAINPYNTPDSFLFYSDNLSDKPIDIKVMSKHFYRALSEIGIDENTRKERNISLHSLRHFCNTIMINAKLPLQMIQSTTGHLTDRMTELYYHVNTDDMGDIRKLQESLFITDESEHTAHQNAQESHRKPQSTTKGII